MHFRSTLGSDLLWRTQDELNQGRRLNALMCMEIAQTLNLMDLGYLAARVAEDIHGTAVSFMESRIIRTATPLSGSMSVNLLIDRAEAIVNQSTGALYLGSVHPHLLSFKFLCETISALKQRFPEILLRVMGAPEIALYARIEGQSIVEILKQLARAGANYLDGRGLSAPNAEQNLSFTHWLDVHRKAHEIGFRSDAAVVYGEGEDIITLVSKLISIRTLQDQTEGFVSIIPIAYHHQDVQSGFHRWTAGAEDLKAFALTRLVIDNIRDIRANWGRLGIDLAQLSLTFGANELEGFVCTRPNSWLSGARPFRGMNRHEIESLCRKADRKPAEKKNLNERFGPTGKESPAKTSVQITSLLYKAEKQVGLSQDECLLLAQEASLSALAYCAAGAKMRRFGKHRAAISISDWTLHPCLTQGLSFPHGYQDAQQKKDLYRVDLDLGLAAREGHLPSLSAVLALLESVFTLPLMTKISVKGLRSLFVLSKKSGITIFNLGIILKNLGVVKVSSSSHESEEDLTFTELKSIHSDLHNAGLETIGKIEIQAPYNGTEKVFWEFYVQKLKFYRDLQDQHKLLGLKVEVAKAARVSPSEYMRALALARIYSNNITHIIAPFQKLPSMAFSYNRFIPQRSRDALKLAPIALHAGADDLDELGVGSVNIDLLVADLIKSGLKPEVIR